MNNEVTNINGYVINDLVTEMQGLGMTSNLDFPKISMELASRPNMTPTIISEVMTRVGGQGAFVPTIHPIEDFNNGLRYGLNDGITPNTESAMVETILGQTEAMEKFEVDTNTTIDNFTDDFVVVGDYSATTTYNKPMMVNYGGKSWQCVVASSVGVTPSDTSANWQPIGARGSSGVIIIPNKDFRPELVEGETPPVLLYKNGNVSLPVVSNGNYPDINVGTADWSRNGIDKVLEKKVSVKSGVSSGSRLFFDIELTQVEFDILENCRFIYVYFHFDPKPYAPRIQKNLSIMYRYEYFVQPTPPNPMPDLWGYTIFSSFDVVAYKNRNLVDSPNTIEDAYRISCTLLKTNSGGHAISVESDLVSGEVTTGTLLPITIIGYGNATGGTN